MSLIVSLFRLLASIISESVRFILFFASLAFLLVSVFLLLLSSQSQYIYSLLEVSDATASLTVVIVLAIYLICLSLGGVYGTFFRSKTSMEMFALLSSLNVIVGFAVLMYSAPRLDDTAGSLKHQLEAYQKKYDWNRGPPRVDKPVDIDETDPTNKWDLVQEYRHCCGLDKPADWLPLAPANHTDEYPWSCCVNRESVMQTGKCTSKMDVWHDGCRDTIIAADNYLILLITALVYLNLMLSVMACLVLCCQQRTSTDGHYYS